MAVTTHFNITWSEAKGLTMAEIGALLRVLELRDEHERREERVAKARSRGMSPVMG